MRCPHCDIATHTAAFPLGSWQLGVSSSRAISWPETDIIGRDIVRDAVIWRVEYPGSILNYNVLLVHF